MKTLVTATRDSARLAPANTETGAAVDAARTMTAICVLSPNSARKRKTAVSQNGCRATTGISSWADRSRLRHAWMTDQVPRPMNKIPPAIRINWSPFPRVTASAPPIVAPIAVAAVRPRTAPGRTLAQGWRVARLMVTSWVLSPISSRATTPRAVAKTRRLSTEGGERPRGYDALDGRFLGRRNLSNVFQIHERIVEFRHVPQHAEGPRSADPHGHIDAQQVLRENSVSIWAPEPEPLSVNPHFHILDQRLHPRCRLDRSLEGGRVLPRERHADVLMQNGTQLDPGLESGAVSIGSGEVTTCGISSHDFP